MDELVIRPNRLPGVFLTVLFVGMFAMNFYAFFVNAGPLQTGSLVMAVVFQAVWVFFVVMGLVRMLTPPLRLTSKGFSIGSRTVAWSDVDKFETPKVRFLFEAGGGKNVRVRYVPGFQRSRLDVALGSIGLGSAPTRIGGMFYRTGDRLLIDVLRRYWLASA
jgi:hypothetical protein